MTSLRGGYSREELEAFGELLVVVLAHLVAGDDGDAGAVRARVLEVVTVEEAGRVAAARLEERMAPVVLAAVEIARSKHLDDVAGDAVRRAARRWLTGKGPEFVFPLVAAVEKLVASRIEGAG